MPLPVDSKNQWPPPCVPQLDFAVWNEWYSGCFSPAGNALSSIPQTSGGVTERLTGGFVHRHPNLKVGSQAPSKPSAQPVHCPLAADLCQVSADLLYGEMPDVKLPDEAEASDDRLDELLEGCDAQNTLLEASEVCAALGGTYLRVTWDTSVADAPFLTYVDADHAVPEFRWGRLWSVLFWRVVSEEGDRVLRHVECHDPGVILHALYSGTKSYLGSRVTLDQSEETADLADVVQLPAELRGGLTTWYVPNVRPNQRNRGSHLGRSDFGGSEDLLDGLDEVYSSLMRDVRLSQSRIIVPSGTLASGDGRGSGKRLDLDREVFTDIDVPPEGMQPTLMQPDIRAERHLLVAVDLVKQIVSKAGYSPQTFGLEIAGRAESGTALRIREERTYRTLSRKRRYNEGALSRAGETLLVIDSTVFGRSTPVARPKIVWRDADLGAGELARTLVDLRTAEAASTETRVRTLHPEWNDTKVTDEVARILSESGMLVPSPPALP